MNMLVGALTFVPLLMVAFAHFLWAFGNTWPIRNEALLAQTVVGIARRSRACRKLLTFGVALAILIAGLIALALADHNSGGPALTGLGALLALIFFGRGVLGYTPAWRARYPRKSRFATLDRKNYSPLCLWIGAGFLILVLMRLI